MTTESKTIYNPRMTRPREFDVDQVLFQTMEVFWTKGFRSTSFEDLTNKTKVKKQSLYGVFKNKRTLFLKALALYRDYNLQNLKEIMARADSPAGKIDAILRASLCTNSEDARRGCLMVNTALEFGVSDLEVTKQVEGMHNDVQLALEEVIEEGQAAGQFTTKFTSRELALHLSNALQGVRVLQKSGVDHQQTEVVLRTAFGLIMH
ncbi:MULTISPECIES: TetR/AcrR family transcriptional regulator [Bacillus subtilis group]|uniref:TetR/AcrR family transcriptional regulator n=1 Tax=Bacillus subtilis group TaxID=653685 RepID=UPI003A888EAB